MKEKIILTIAAMFAATSSFFCKEKSHKKDGKIAVSTDNIKNDSISHKNGKKLFGIYCVTCHRSTNTLPLLGNSKDISSDRFISILLKDTLETQSNKKKDTHLKFGMLTKKDISDIKYYLDGG